MNVAASARVQVNAKAGTSKTSMRKTVVPKALPKAVRASKAAPAMPFAVSCSTDEEKVSPMKQAGAALASLAASASLLVGTPDMAQATEIEILQTPAPTEGYIVDDARVLSRAGAGALSRVLKDLEKNTGYHLNVVTVRKLVFEQDPFAFGDKVLETWYPTLEEGNNKGNLLLVQVTKEGAVVGGPNFLKAVGDDVLDSILTKNIPINLEDDKFNQALTSSVERISAVLEGKPDPGPPATFEKKKGSNYRTKDETTAKREVFSNVVIGLLVISFVVPMLQYFGYVAGDPTARD